MHRPARGCTLFSTEHAITEQKMAVSYTLGAVDEYPICTDLQVA